MKKILIAASNDNDRKLLTYYIKKYFVAELIFANNANSAINMLTLEPDIIFYDSYMEEGEVFINYCKKDGYDIPIIAITSLNEVDIMEKLYSLGVMSYLAKPFNSFHLYEKLEELFK